MKRLLKRLALAAVLVLVATAAFQVWEFMAFYNRVRDTLELELDHYHDLGREGFVRSLIRAEERNGLRLEPQGITIDEDRTKQSVRVEFTYRREMRILVFSFEREMLVWRTLRDVDFG